MPTRFFWKAETLEYEASDHEGHWKLHYHGKSSLTTKDKGKQVRWKARIESQILFIFSYFLLFLSPLTLQGGKERFN